LAEKVFLLVLLLLIYVYELIVDCSKIILTHIASRGLRGAEGLVVEAWLREIPTALEPTS
jgi:hypothetical protein